MRRNARPRRKPPSVSPGEATNMRSKNGGTAEERCPPAPNCDCKLLHIKPEGGGEENTRGSARGDRTGDRLRSHWEFRSEYRNAASGNGRTTVTPKSALVQRRCWTGSRIARAARETNSLGVGHNQTIRTQPPAPPPSCGKIPSGRR
jgi:hypothetical protein